MVARDRNDGPRSAWRRHPERIPFSLHHEYGPADLLELNQTAFRRIIGLARRVQWKRQTEDGVGTGLGRSAAGNPCTG
jgi:hypothetical protein